MTETEAISPWHDQALKRFDEAMTERFTEIAARHGVDQEYLSGWLEWFAAAYPEHHAKYRAAEEKVDSMAREGRTDGESQREFNDALRLWRDGACWAAERYIDHKKQQTAESQAAAAHVGRQEPLL